MILCLLVCIHQFVFVKFAFMVQIFCQCRFGLVRQWGRAVQMKFRTDFEHLNSSEIPSAAQLEVFPQEIYER